MSGDDDRQPPWSSLPREVEPPRALERRLVAELGRRGVLRRGAPTRARLAWAAGLLVAFALGWGLGGRSSSGAPAPSAAAGGQYLLLLYEPRPLDRPGGDLVAEYSSWARGLARDGRLIVAEKLGAGETRLGVAEPTGSAGSAPTGFFLIRASSLDDALAVARGCPHLVHGGEISVRPVDPT
jgi:hypothetical protein